MGEWRDLVIKWRRLTKWELVHVPLYRTAAKVKLLKTLLCSYCNNDCKYCMFRRSRSSTLRRIWNPEKLVNIAIELWKARVINGVFISSALYKDPDTTVEMELEVVEELRKRGFKGYIHLRLMPGTSRALLKRAIEIADRAGINIEAPTRYEFEDIAPDKGDWYRDIINKLSYMAQLAKRRNILRAGVDTQTIVGFGNDTDLEHLKTAEMLFRIGVRRIYFSPFIPIKNTPLESKAPAPKWRCYRLFQAAELIRSYGFTIKELEDILIKDMLPNRDPKELYAEINKEFFPIDLNTATYNELVRVPGIGPRTARRILKLRNEERLSKDNLLRILGKKYKKVLKYITL